MSGIKFNISVDDLDVRQVLNDLLRKGQSLRPAMKKIGEYMIEVHENRFEAQIGPDGRRWAPLNKVYAARKPRHKNMILVLNEFLANSFIYHANDTELVFGTDRQYAALHQFGFTGSMAVSAHARRDKKTGKTSKVSAHTRKVNIPARPFMGIADGDDTPVKIIGQYPMDRRQFGHMD